MTESLKSEIEYIKTMADKGKNGPLPIALILIVAGTLFLATLGAHRLYLNSVDDFSEIDFGPFSAISFLGMWSKLGSVLLIIVGTFLFRKRIFGIQERSVSNVISRSVWFAIFAFLTTSFITSIAVVGSEDNLESQIKGWQLYNSTDLQSLIGHVYWQQILGFNFPARILPILGLGWWVCADASKYNWLKYFSWAAFAIAPIAAFYAYLPINEILGPYWTLGLFLLLPATLLQIKQNQNLDSGSAR